MLHQKGIRAKPSVPGRKERRKERKEGRVNHTITRKEEKK